jgi:hypothetical protein
LWIPKILTKKNWRKWPDVSTKTKLFITTDGNFPIVSGSQAQISNKKTDEIQRLDRILHPSKDFSYKAKDIKSHSRYVLVHYNMLGLNLFKKRVRDERTGKDGVNVIVADDDAMTEGHKEFVEANRGLYTKSEFGKGVHLLTRKMTIREMEKIALKVIGGREWGGVFKCPHFVYNFVRSIIPKQSLDGLKTLENWPENMRVLDEGYKRTLGSYAFDESLELQYV